MVCIQQCRCLSSWVQEQHAESLVLAAPSRNRHSKNCATQHYITPNTMAVEVLSLLGTCPELLIRRGTSDWREMKGTHLCYLLSILLSLRVQDMWEVGRVQQSRFAVRLPPFLETPQLVFELLFWAADGMVVLWWAVTVGKSAVMSGSLAEMCQLTLRWQSGPVTHLTSRDWSLIGTTHSLLGNCRLTEDPKDSHETPGKGYDSKAFLSLWEGNPIFWAEPHTSDFSLKDIERKLSNRG